MKKIIDNSVQNLSAGNTILYPTDTVWGLGCDATNEKAVAKIYQIKQREESKSLIVLVDSLEMLTTYITEIPRNILEILKKTTRPTTIIYNNPSGLAQNVITKDNTVAIRIVQSEFCQQLIKKFSKPIVSTSANISGDSTPKQFKEINSKILDAVDYVVNLQQDEVSTQSSKIIRILETGEIEIIRD